MRARVPGRSTATLSALPVTGIMRMPLAGSDSMAGGAQREEPMFVVDETTVAVVQRAYAEKGELAAVAELRRIYHGLDGDDALHAVRAIAAWRPLPPGSPVGRRSMA